MYITSGIIETEGIEHKNLSTFLLAHGDDNTYSKNGYVINENNCMVKSSIYKGHVQYCVTRNSVNLIFTPSIRDLSLNKILNYKL